MVAETGTERDAFLALVYADADWLRAEFDAIVAAGWDGPPAGPERPGRPVPAPVPAVAGTGRRHPALRPQPPVAACPARERSPPGAPPGTAGRQWGLSRYVEKGVGSSS